MLPLNPTAAMRLPEIASPPGGTGNGSGRDVWGSAAIVDTSLVWVAHAASVPSTSRTATRVPSTATCCTGAGTGKVLTVPPDAARHATEPFAPPAPSYHATESADTAGCASPRALDKRSSAPV